VGVFWFFFFFYWLGLVSEVGCSLLFVGEHKKGQCFSGPLIQPIKNSVHSQVDRASTSVGLSLGISLVCRFVFTLSLPDAQGVLNRSKMI
jgi:hypothetical protein